MCKKVKVNKLPCCDMCGSQAKYDGKTVAGSWANMCVVCFTLYGVGLGLGIGQELILQETK